MSWDPNYLPSVRAAMVRALENSEMREEHAQDLMYLMGEETGKDPATLRKGAEAVLVLVHQQWRMGELFTATDAMVDLALADDSTEPLMAEAVPSLRGVLFLDTDMTRDADGERLSIGAFSWTESERGCVVTVWIRAAHPWVKLTPSFTWRQAYGEEVNNVAAQLFARTLTMMTTPVVRLVPHTPDRLTAKRFRKQHRPTGPVTVLDLAPIRSERNPEAEPTGRHLEQRHLVRGHWRNQPTRDGVRRIFIREHFQGPPDAPIRNSERVYRWKRTA